MNCAKARTHFSAYVEQELSESDRRAVSTHLGRCDECSRDLFAMQKAVNLLRWVPKVDARPGFEDRLSERLHTPAAKPSPWTWLEQWRELGERLEAGARTFFGETLVATPASALLLAVLVGTGGGALVMHQVMRSGGQAPAELAASTPEIMSAPGITPSGQPAASSATPAEPASSTGPAPTTVVASNAGAVVPQAGAEPATDDSQLAAQTAPNRSRAETGAAGSRPNVSGRRSTRRPIEAPVIAASNPSRMRPGMEVAPWAKNQQPIEGPPSVSQVEYILDLVDVNQERVLQLPASAVVSGGTVTF
jgi:Putative zinc-finger